MRNKIKDYNSKSTSDKLMNIDEVALYLRIPLKTAYRIAKQGKIKGVKIGKHWRFLKQDIDYYLLYGKNKVYIPEQITSTERRTSPRINCSLPCSIKVIIPKKKEIHTQGIILNIGEGGVFLDKLFLDIRNDDPLGLEFELDGRGGLNIDGRVLRTQDNGVAVKFRDISGEAREMICGYVG